MYGDQDASGGRLPHDGRNLPQRRPEAGSLDLWVEPAGEAAVIDLAQYWRLLLKHRFLIGGIFLAAMALGVAATLLMTPIYTASATLQIDREAARVVETDDVAPRESMIAGEEFFQTQYGLLRSRSLAERVVDALGLARDNEFLEEMGASAPSEGSEAERSTARRIAVLNTVRDNLGVQPVRGSRLVGVSFDSPSPGLSARVANAFAENFIQSNLDRKFESSSYARQFLEERIAQTKTRLEQAERELVAYAAEQQIINVAEPGAGGANDGSQSLAASDLNALNASLARARAARIAAEAKWRQASSSALMSQPEILQNPAVQRMSEQRATLSAEYQEKLRVFRPDYPEMQQLSAQIAEIDRQIQSVASNIRGSVRQQYQAALSEEQALEARVNSLKSDVLDFRDRSVQYNILQREVDTTRTLYDGLLQRYKEVGVTGGVTTNNVSIVDRAEPPRAPSKPNLMLNLALAAALGLGLGVLAAFAAEALDDSLAAPEDVEVKLGIPVMGVVPKLAKSTTPIQALADARSSFSEAYYSLRTALQFSTSDGVPPALLVTSSRPGEGKSTTALAIAANFAGIGKRVLLIDGDLRKPSLHRLIGVNNDRGVSNILSGAATIHEVVQRSEDPNLSFIPCGPLPPNPAELLGAGRVRALLEEASSIYDLVVIDGPPVLGFADAPLLASHVPGTLFVLESRMTRRGQARGGLRRLGQARARVLGAVLTKFAAPKGGYGYGYYYDYDYGRQEPNSPQ